MREIKFRGYSKKYKRWFYGCLLIDETQKSFYIVDNMTGIAVEVEKETIGQYTGLKDKNGKEICEGDIVRCSFYPDYIFEIKFEELCWYMRKITTSEYINLSDASYYDLEVIGNIYDNPELLEVKDE